MDVAFGRTPLMKGPDDSSRRRQSPIPLAHVADVMAGIAPSEGEREACEYPCVLPAQIGPGGLSGLFGLLRHAVVKDETRFLRPGDVLLRRLNPVGAVVCPGSEGEVLASINVLVVRPGPDLLSDYLAFLFDASPILPRLLQRSGVGSAVSSLSPHRLGEASIPVPSRETQRRLALVWRASLRAETALRSWAEGHARFRRLLGEAALRSHFDGSFHAAESRIPGSSAFRDAAGTASLALEGQL